MGGAHAIAAFAYGTKTVPRADRIVGPGNIYVAAAKKLLAGEVGIDFVAGPTEILIIADGRQPRWIAADMLAQAEHDTDATAILLTTSPRLAAAVGEASRAATGRRCRPRRSPAPPSTTTAPSSWSRDSAEAVELSNRFAPEHLSHPRRDAAPRHSPRRQRLHRRRPAPKPRATTPPARTTCCPPPARRGCAAASPRPTS